MKQSPAVTYPTAHGPLTLVAFEESAGDTHVALVKGGPSDGTIPSVRIQSACVTSTALAGRMCDCAEQMNRALALISREAWGVFIYLDDEGRGMGLFEKAVTMKAMADGADTVDAFVQRGLPPDRRLYASVPYILDSLNIGGAVALLTNNPAKVTAVESTGRRVERIPLEITPTELTRRYLQTKKHKLGHLLTLVE